MTSNFPGSLDSLSNPSGDTQTTDPTLLHSIQHTNANDILEAIEAKLGIGASVPGTTDGVLRRTGNGVSQWGQIVNADIDAAANINGSKLADGTIPWNKLATATLTGMWYYSGPPSLAQISNANGWVTIPGLVSASITPASATSFFVCCVVGNFETNLANTRGTLRVYDTLGNPWLGSPWINCSDPSSLMVLFGVFQPGNTTARTIFVQFSCIDGGGALLTCAQNQTGFWILEFRR